MDINLDWEDNSSILPKTIRGLIVGKSGCGKTYPQELHLVKVTKAREYYKGMVSDSKNLIKELGITNLQRSPPMFRNIRMHYSFDYAQQVMFPNDPLQPGPMYFLTRWLTHNISVNCS